MSIELAQRVLEYLYRHNMGFVFLPTGELIDRQKCIDIIYGGE